MTKGVRMEGINELTRDFNKLSKAFEPKQIADASLKSAEIIAKEAKRRAPRGKTGKLKESIEAKPLQIGFKGEITTAIAAVNRPIAPHAHLIEDGTSHMAAQPFFRPAVMSKSREAADRFENALANMVNRAVT